MKKTAKILSVLLALVLAFSVCLIPVSAADANFSFRMELTPVIGEVDTTGVKSEDAGIYKLTLYLTSNYRTPGFIIDMHYDPAIFTPVDANSGQIVYDYLCDASYPNIAYNFLGSLADTQGYDANGNPGRAVYYGGSHPSAQKSFKANYKAAGIILISYQCGQNTMEPGGSVDEGIVELYLRLNKGATADGAKFRFGKGPVLEDPTSSKSVGYDTAPTHGRFYVMGVSQLVNILDLESIIMPDYTYTEAPVVTGPVVTKTQAEVKMTLNEDQTAVDYAAAPFQFRVISSISEDDWNTYFKGDGSNIESVGFVAYKGDGAFDMETAKSVAMGDSAADYQAAKTDYIQKVDGQPANFGARIDFTARENVKDVTYIAFVQYDTDQFAFYDTSFDADLNSNYDDIVSQYAGFIAG